MHSVTARLGGTSGYQRQGTYSVFPAAGSPQSVGQLPTHPANAWSGTAVNTTRGSLTSSNGYNNNRFAGHASANGYNHPVWSGHSQNGYYNNGGRYRFPYSYYNYPYAYGPYYAPYIGYYGGAYPYYADGTYSDIANGSDGYGDGAATVTPQYVDQGQDANADSQQQGSATQQPPAPQVDPRSQGGGNATQGTVPNNGPDSLVEAVQQELIRRGYFGGKVDAMYGPDTKEALRKFQRDHHLADTGLINEATLHALQLD